MGPTIYYCPFKNMSRYVLLQNTYVAGFHTSTKFKVSHPFKMNSQKIREKQRSTVESVTSENQHEVISDMVTPFWKLSYEEELKIKQKRNEDVISHVLNSVASKYSERNEKKVVGDIIASPVRDAYRNKDEFSVWPGLDGNPKTVGFFVGSPAVGKVVCIPPTNLRCIKKSHKQIAQLYQDYIRSSPLPVSYQLFDEGFWRNIHVRSNGCGDHMATVITNPASYTPDQITEQQDLLKQYVSQHMPNVSLYHQSCPHLRCTRDQAPLHHLYGQPYLTEQLSNFTIRLSPDSFFQQNKAAAELMYEQVLRLAKLKHTSTLLDLYCGIGGISLLASDRVRGCVGIDEGKAAVDDAKYNALSNNVTNCSYVQGRVEVMLPSVLKKLDYATDIIAVVNPGRGGASESVISLLRRQRHIQRVIYISCKPDNVLTMKNFTQLCERVAPGSNPFHLTAAVSVDLFPYTEHCELILCFEKR